MPSRQLTRLLNLPDDILLLIFAQPAIAESPSSLLYLGSLCTRLNHLCLPLYLAEYGITSPSTKTIFRLDRITPDSPHTNPLYALRIAFFVTHIDTLECTFRKPVNRGVELRELLAQFEELEMVLDRLDYVKEVKLLMNAPESWDDKGARVDRTTYLAGDLIVTNDARLRPVTLADWVSSYGALLNRIIEKSAESITLAHEKLPMHDHVLEPSWPMHATRSQPELSHTDSSQSIGRKANFRDLVSRLPGPNSLSSKPPPPQFAAPLYHPLRLSGPSWTYRLVAEGPITAEMTSAEVSHRKHSSSPNPLGHVQEDLVMSPSRSIKSNSTLHTLSINSALLLLPPCFHWTLHLLHSSLKLSALHLSDINLGHSFWAAILPYLWSAIPHLSVLHIRKCKDIQADDIAEFLLRCPELHEVVMDRHTQCPDDKLYLHGLKITDDGQKERVPRLENLKVLEAPWQWILYLLDYAPEMKGILPGAGSGDIKNGGWIAKKLPPLGKWMNKESGKKHSRQPTLSDHPTTRFSQLQTLTVHSLGYRSSDRDQIEVLHALSTITSHIRNADTDSARTNPTKLTLTATLGGDTAWWLTQHLEILRSSPHSAQALALVDVLIVELSYNLIDNEKALGKWLRTFDGIRELIVLDEEGSAHVKPTDEELGRRREMLVRVLMKYRRPSTYDSLKLAVGGEVVEVEG